MKYKIIGVHTIVITLSTIYYLYILCMYSLLKDEKTDETGPESCVVPMLNPFDKSILEFIKKPDNIVCSQNGPLVDSDLNYLFINEHLLPVYGVNNISEFNCCYQAFERTVPKEFGSDGDITYLGNCKPFFPKAKIEDEFVEVSCKFDGEKMYHDMHSFVPIKQNRTYVNTTKQKLNVVIFGIDSLSHMNFQRQMPKTKKYLDENLNAIPIFGFNKIADNTFPNLMPILTGKSEKELRKTCWKTASRKFDKCHFIWNDFSNAGYLTAFAEDAPSMGLFHLHRTGFKIQPTHYYWRTFCNYADHLLGKGYCLGPRPSHKVLLDYAKKFTLTLKDEPFFGFFWSVTLSHNHLNDPSLGDEDYVEFFDLLKRENILNNTVVIFLSDHGLRNGDILRTYQGYMEERLPLLYFIFPPSFHKQYQIAIRNMRDNSNRLTSNFDIHETIKDLLDVEKLKNPYLVKNKLASLGKRGQSLFLIIPENRTCEMAEIPSHWCTCKKRREININDTIVEKTAEFIVSQLNKLLVHYDKCATLYLDSIQAAKVTKTKLKNYNVFREYTITLKTNPDDALFESTVRCSGNCYDEDSYAISGIVSRLNMYGNRSSCISHQLLRMYCYCI